MWVILLVLIGCEWCLLVGVVLVLVGDAAGVGWRWCWWVRWWCWWVILLVLGGVGVGG